MRKKSSKIVGGACASLLILVSGVIVAASQVQATIQPGVVVGPVDVGGLTQTAAAKKLRVWWQTKRNQPLTLVWENHNIQFPKFSASQLGVTIADQQTVQTLPIVTLVAQLKGVFVKEVAQGQHFPIEFQNSGADISPEINKINSLLPKEQPAVVHFIKGKGLFKKPEIGKTSIDRSKMFSQVALAINTDQPVNLPIQMGPVTVTAKDLDSITDFMSSYTTHFPSHMTDRNTNIRLASEALNGVVLLPGQVMSFNQTVGKRTVEKGYRVATVFVNGQDSHGVGGGICQVSTTLYNACLLGDLGIEQRQNHSMPVGYIPLGRDATVDYGAIDLKVKNTYNFPIAITSEYQSGTLTFRIFGRYQNGITIHIERTDFGSVKPRTETSINPKLPPGTTKIIDDGEWGRKVHTYRLVYKDGKLIRKDDLGWSVYISKPRIVEKGPSVASPPSLTVPAGSNP